MDHGIGGVQRILHLAKYSLNTSTGFADEAVVRLSQGLSRRPVFFRILSPVSWISQRKRYGAWKVKPSLADRRIALDSFRLGTNRFFIRRHAAGAKAASTPTPEYTAEKHFPSLSNQPQL